MAFLRHSLFLSLFSIALFFNSCSSDRPPFACDTSNPSTHKYRFCNPSLPITERVHDLVSHLTLDEKISQLVNAAPAIPRLGIPSYEWWSEALHGVADIGNGIRLNGTIKSATSFPQVILTAASFNPHLWYRIGQAIGIEARGVYNNGQATGMTFWAPNINIFRDPRWGRGQETPGEDPLMASNYAVAYVRGVQGDSFEGGKLGVEHLRASACCKHFTAYDLDRWNGITRYAFNAKVSVQDLADSYQPPFKSCVEEGHASGIMCSYNSVNGKPTCADYDLLSNTARKKWGFYGYITSDCDAVSIIYTNHRYVKTPEDAVADVLKAGMDVNCGFYLQKHTKAAVQKRKVLESDINRALYNLFSIRMRLGLFKGDPKRHRFGNIGANRVCSKKHLNLALVAARDGIVLLKNSAKLLPLSRAKTSSIAVIGPNADNSTVLLGNYHGRPCKSISPLQALKSYAKDVLYYPGCDSVACSSVLIDKAVDVAKEAEQVILIMGLDQTQEREDYDRVNLVLPGKQQQLITSVARAAQKPVVLVLLSGGPLDVTFAKYDPKIGGILWAGYPGEAGGIALADTIFGTHNPGGKLPITWYPQAFTKVAMTDMRMRPDTKSGYPGRTYRFYSGKKVFRFGYGLSYTTYKYEFVSVTQSHLFLNQSVNLQASENSIPSQYDTEKMGPEFCDKLKFSAVVGVKNHGDMPGRHPVLLFLRRPEAPSGSPMKQLVGFQSIHLNAGERAEMEFVLKPCEHLGRTVEDGSKVMEAGSHFLVVGDAEYQVTVV